MKVSVVVPTYNEKENIKLVIWEISEVMKNRDYEIIVVDDNSPDGTARIAAGMAKHYPITVIKREGVRGLGTAILEGFRNSHGHILGVIDADLQHPPSVLSPMITAVENGADIAIASRYAPGGGVENWSLPRRLVSRGATLLAEPLAKAKDPMSGCFILARGVLEGKDIRTSGYKLLLEILVKTRDYRIVEVPYVFRSRQAGKSKLGLEEYLRYLGLLFRLYSSEVKNRLVSTKISW